MDPSKPFVLEMNYFYFVLSIMLSQFGEIDLHPINSHFHKFYPIEINYKIIDKKFICSFAQKNST
jgi:hypothetical protein